ncbi:MAG: hypothetical protein ABIM50_03365 [Novosphingobium sp.]
MDTLRGDFTDINSSGNDAADYDRGDDETVRELPPLAIGNDERRMQVRAYNFWASLLSDSNFPSIEDLDPENLPDFGPHSVLFDFSHGADDPSVVFLGSKLVTECGTEGPIHKLSDVPSRSLLSRITDHHMQIIANQAPIGFEAEFVNQRGVAIMYRGILLPFSSDNDTIDFIFGVINWKELADQQTTDELLLEIEQALETAPEIHRITGPLTEWADGPADLSSTLELGGEYELSESEALWLDPVYGTASAEAPANADADARFAPVSAEPEPMELADWLASAREYALAAQGTEDRSRLALYAAIARAYDFSLAARGRPEEFAELVAEAGLTVQERAPMTPLVKLVFGANYDKTRLTEYAAVLGHGHRLGLTRGAMAEFLLSASGGLKGLVAAERQLRREEEGASALPRQNPRERLARKLRKLEHSALGDVASEGSEFTLLVARRLADGQVVLLGEVADDALLLERAARRLIG